MHCIQIDKMHPISKSFTGLIVFLGKNSHRVLDHALK